jgi:hypothetical protein
MTLTSLSSQSLQQTLTELSEATPTIKGTTLISYFVGGGMDM